MLVSNSTHIARETSYKFNLVYISIFDYYKILNSAKCLLYLAWPLLHRYIVSFALNPFKADILKSYVSICVFSLKGLLQNHQDSNGPWYNQEAIGEYLLSQCKRMHLRFQPHVYKLLCI